MTDVQEQEHDTVATWGDFVGNCSYKKAEYIIALHGTATHVETQELLYHKVKRIEALEDENLRHGHRELSWHIDDDGCYVFKGVRAFPGQFQLFT